MQKYGFAVVVKRTILLLHHLAASKLHSKCFQMFPGCSKFFQTLPKCFKTLPNASEWFQMLPNVSNMLPNDWKMLPNASKMLRKCFGNASIMLANALKFFQNAFQLLPNCSKPSRHEQKTSRKRVTRMYFRIRERRVTSWHWSHNFPL